MTSHENLKKDNNKLLRLGGVLDKFPVSRSAWYDGVKKGIYPAGIKLGGGRTVAWTEASIDELIQSLAADTTSSGA